MTKLYPAGTKLRNIHNHGLRYVVIYHDEKSFIVERMTPVVDEKIGTRLYDLQTSVVELIPPRELQVGDQYTSKWGKVITVEYIHGEHGFIGVWRDGSRSFVPYSCDWGYTPVGDAPKFPSLSA